MSEEGREIIEDVENEQRRDDVLERQFARGEDRNDDVFQTRERERQEDRQRGIRAEEELRHIRLSNLANAQSILDREREATFVAAEDRDTQRFRDSTVHSTAMGGIEEEIEENALAEDAPADK